MQLTAQQSNALLAVEAWLKTDEPIFRLFGYAGCGKTTIAKFVQQMVQSYVYATFTGKAASVLISKGCSPASTLHSAMYRVEQDERNGKLSFHLNYDSVLSLVDLVIVDEVSQVDDDLGSDVMRLAKKVLVLGDPGQLPPLEGEGYFTGAIPDVLLTEIHRQAADSPIIQLATKARLGEPIKVGAYGNCKVVKSKSFNEGELTLTDQILVGTNATRRYYNGKVRQLKDLNSDIPLKGERLICLKNNKERGFLNGTIWQADEDAVERGQDVSLLVSPLDSQDAPARILTPIEYFIGGEDQLDWRIKKNADQFTYGYTITTHKSQGSEWNHVTTIDQSKVFKEYSKNWLYTALTRASQGLTLVV